LHARLRARANFWTHLAQNPESAPGMPALQLPFGRAGSLLDTFLQRSPKFAGSFWGVGAQSSVE